LPASNSPKASSTGDADRAKKPKSTKAKRKEFQVAQDLEEEERLTSLLFGGGGRRSSNSYPAAEQTKVVDENDETPFSFEIDRTGISEEHKSEGERMNVERIDEEEVDDESDGPAWVDEDDAGLEVNLLGTSRLRKLRKSKEEEAASALSGVELEKRLRQRYQSTTQATARTDWARLDEKEDSDEDQSDVEGLQSLSAPLILQASASQILPANILNIMRCPDANQADPNQSTVQAVHFHPGSDPDRPLLLTAGLDKTLRFFQVGTEKSEKIHGIHCKLLDRRIG
jgi:hypothetical protein